MPISTQILALCASEVVAHFRQALCSVIGLEEGDDFRVLYAERDLGQGDEKQEASFKDKLESGKPVMVRVLYRLLGGKGGFGALLRKQANKGKKTTNFDAMRDLTGRRLRHSTAVDRIKEWMEKQNKEDELVNLIAGEGPELPKPVPASESLDPNFVRALKRSSAERPAVVTEGLRALVAAEEEETVAAASAAKRPRGVSSSAAAASSWSGAAALDALADISGSENSSPDGEEASPDGEEVASTAATKQEEKKAPEGAPTAPSTAPAVSAASALAEVIAESFCAATDMEATESQRSKRETVGNPESVAAAAAACIGVQELAKFKDAGQLEAKVSADILKASLQKLGLKCGGTPKDRALRLFQLKTTKLEDLPKKDFAKA